MVNGELGFITSILGMFLIISCVSLWMLLHKEPVRFYTGSPVNPNMIRDTKKYNQANAIMWFTFGSLYLLAIPLILLGQSDFATLLLFIISFGGCFSLSHFDKRIRSKYHI